MPDESGLVRPRAIVTPDRESVGRRSSRGRVPDRSSTPSPAAFDTRRSLRPCTRARIRPVIGDARLPRPLVAHRASTRSHAREGDLVVGDGERSGRERIDRQRASVVEAEGAVGSKTYEACRDDAVADLEPDPVSAIAVGRCLRVRPRRASDRRAVVATAGRWPSVHTTTAAMAIAAATTIAPTLRRRPARRCRCSWSFHES